MASVSVMTFSFLLATAFSAPVKVNDEVRTVLDTKDFTMELTSPLVEVTFRNRTAQRLGEVPLLRNGNVIGSRAKLHQSRLQLIIDTVSEQDEGVYTIRDPEKPRDAKRITLVVRDCTEEETLKYGDNFYIELSGATPPITLEYKPSSVEASQTSRPGVVLYSATAGSRDDYQGRIHVDQRHVTLSNVTSADEGSYSVRDGSGVVRTKKCLNIKAFSALVKANDEVKTLLDKEDFHIELTSPMVEVTFRNRSAQRLGEVPLLRNGKAIGGRAKLHQGLGHLIIDDVSEEDEGVYTIRDPEKPGDAKRITLVVRDCTVEDIVKYGDNYHIQLSGVTPPITLDYKPMAVEANQTSSKPGIVLYTAAGMSRDGYQGRIQVNDRQVTLTAVTAADEGSYNVRDVDGVIKRKNCLNVKEHIHFVTLPHGKKLKINLILNSSLVQLTYTPDDDPTPRLLLDKGVIPTEQVESGYEDRLSLDGTWVILDQVKAADVGQYKVTDILGFTFSTTHLKLEPYKLESLYVAIIALVGLLVFLLLVCLLSCLIKVKKRAKRAAALEKIAQNAGKEDEGEAFREVVKNITKLSEESKHSQADNTEKSQSTEVDIKGLEVSSKEVGIGNLETSDSGVGFNTALPLDTDTDAPDQNLDSVAVSVSESKPSPPPPAAAAAAAAAAAESEAKPSAPPAVEIKSSPVAETKTSPAPETKKTPDQPVEVKLDVPKPADAKLSPASSPEPKAGLSPADPKPAPTPSPEPKPAAPKAPTPTPESKSSLTPAPETPKPTTPEPITNGTPEPGPDSKLSPDHADVIAAPKAAPAKTPEVELKPATLEPSKDGAVAEDSTTTT